jgi:hypothetical protein
MRYLAARDDNLPPREVLPSLLEPSERPAVARHE